MSKRSKARKNELLRSMGNLKVLKAPEAKQINLTDVAELKRAAEAIRDLRAPVRKSWWRRLLGL